MLPLLKEFIVVLIVLIVFFFFNIPHYICHLFLNWKCLILHAVRGAYWQHQLWSAEWQADTMMGNFLSFQGPQTVFSMKYTEFPMS